MTPHPGTDTDPGTDPGRGVPRILLADDHPVFRRGLLALLDSVPDVLVVAQAATGREAVNPPPPSIPTSS